MAPKSDILAPEVLPSSKRKQKVASAEAIPGGVIESLPPLPKKPRTSTNEVENQTKREEDSCSWRFWTIMLLILLTLAPALFLTFKGWITDGPEEAICHVNNGTINTLTSRSFPGEQPNSQTEYMIDWNVTCTREDLVHFSYIYEDTNSSKFAEERLETYPINSTNRCFFMTNTRKTVWGEDIAESRKTSVYFFIAFGVGLFFWIMAILLCRSYNQSQQENDFWNYMADRQIRYAQRKEREKKKAQRASEIPLDEV